MPTNEQLAAAERCLAVIGGVHCGVPVSPGRVLLTADVIAVCESLRARQWRPIAEAPKDGTEILGATTFGVEVVRWNQPDKSWESSKARLGTYAITHWQPLPQHPAEG